MRKLKIIQILPTLNTGGVQRGVLDFNKYLVNKGHQSYVISNGGRQVKNIVEDGGIHMHLQVSEKSIFTLLQAKKLADIINEISPDIVHIRSRIPAWVLQTSKLFLKNPRPMIFSTFHGLYSTPFYSRIMASFDRVISISKTVDQYVNKNYQRYLKKPPRLIYEGADEKFFYPKFFPSNDYKDYFYKKFPNLKNKRIISFPEKERLSKINYENLPFLKGNKFKQEKCLEAWLIEFLDSTNKDILFGDQAKINWFGNYLFYGVQGSNIDIVADVNNNTERQIFAIELKRDKLNESNLKETVEQVISSATIQAALGAKFRITGLNSMQASELALQLNLRNSEAQKKQIKRVSG